MEETVDICRLDYLVGTLATAYKGLITSLVMKDFCMTEAHGGVTFKGTILSMPEGRYKASLMHEGMELSTAQIRDGYFEFAVGTDRIHAAKNLQIDIVQDGRHIGTFLLKRDKPDQFFTTALELSEETKDMNLALLAASVKEKPGLLKNAEEIVSAIVSAKKDWRKLSDKIQSFAKDLFWTDRRAHFLCYDIFVKYSIAAAEKIDPFVSYKPVMNFIDLIEFPLRQETDHEQLHMVVQKWLRGMGGSSIDLSYSLTQVKRVVHAMNSALPDIDPGPLMRPLIVSLSKRIEKTPVISDAVLGAVQGFLASDDFGMLSRYSGGSQRTLLHTLGSLEALLDTQAPGATIEQLDRIEPVILDDTGMVDLFFTAIERNLTRESEHVLFEALVTTLSSFGMLSLDASRRVLLNTAGFIGKLAAAGMIGSCLRLLTRIGAGGLFSKEEILLNPEVASSILATANDSLIAQYAGLVKQITIPVPRIRGLSSDTWAEIVNPLHLERLTQFLKVLGLDNGRFRDVLVHVICNLSVGGVFIPDDRLFQREVSSYLNAGVMRENFFLNYILLRKLPVYYHEVAATGKMRDYTTEIDSWGNDVLLYFLRKQVHVNASNYNVSLVADIIRSWLSEDPDVLKGEVPEEVLNKINGDLLRTYASAIRPLFQSMGIIDDEGLHIERILQTTEEELRHGLKDIGTSDEVRSKIVLLCVIYQELVKKYSLLGTAAEDGQAMIPDSVRKLRDLGETVVSSQKTEPRESLFFKRHIAFGIPSVMGSYHEPKLDSLGEIFRTEESMRVVFESVISEIKEKKTFSGQDLRRWFGHLEALRDLFNFHGLQNAQVDELVAVLQSNRLHLSQIADLLKIWQKELIWMVMFCHRTFHDPLVQILESFPADEFPERLVHLNPRDEDFVNKAADIVIRDIISSIAGFEELDRFIDSLSHALRLRIDSGNDEEIFLSADKGGIKNSYLIGELSDDDAVRLGPILGSKAKNLFSVSNRGLPVPAGVVFPAPDAPDFLDPAGEERMTARLKEEVKKIEGRSGKRFDDPERPLFLSVRSGSYISMPGILSSILYCGMNRKTLEGFIQLSGDPLLGWDSYRRFIEHYATVVHGLDMKIFEDITDRILARRAGADTRDLTAEESEEIVGRFLSELEERNLNIPEDPYGQLLESVKAVYRSWDSVRAVQFRKATDASPHWGTSVMLMEMIPGNAKDGGASVFFTRNPFSLEKGIYGETREAATGDDLVYGRLVNRPLSRDQTIQGQRSLEETDPDLFRKHEEIAVRIEEAMHGLPQEVEAVYITKPDGKRSISVLQTKRMELHRGFTRRFHDVCQMEANVIGRGIGVQGGALSGIAIFSSSPKALLKLREQGQPLILLRRSASTDDVSLMPEIDGIITSTGGATSHAAVLAQKFNLTAVVGCADMVITDENGKISAKIGDYTITEGTVISIDGSTGLVYSGVCPVFVQSRAY